MLSFYMVEVHSYMPEEQSYIVEDCCEIVKKHMVEEYDFDYMEEDYGFMVE